MGAVTGFCEALWRLPFLPPSSGWTSRWVFWCRLRVAAWRKVFLQDAQVCGNSSGRETGSAVDFGWFCSAPESLKSTSLLARFISRLLLLWESSSSSSFSTLSGFPSAGCVWFGSVLLSVCSAANCPVCSACSGDEAFSSCFGSTELVSTISTAVEGSVSDTLSTNTRKAC